MKIMTNKEYKNILEKQQELYREIEALETELDDLYGYIKQELIHKKSKEELKYGLNTIIEHFEKGKKNKELYMNK